MTTSTSFETLFRPRSIAIVGASSNPLAIGGQPIRYLREKGFDGDVFPINPRHAEIGGLKSYPSLAALPSAPDLVVSLAATRAAMHKRPARPLFFIDQALPRDVDPAVAKIDNVFLYNLDDLAKIAEENRAAREAEIAKCRAIVVEKADHLWRQVAPQIEALGARADLAPSVQREEPA